VKIGALSEADLDLFYLFELATDRRFARWIAAKVPGWPSKELKLNTIRRSVDTGNGETDLELTFEASTKKTWQLLIENKIGAAFQKGQLKRYRVRAALVRKRGGHEDVGVMLLCPKGYIRGHRGDVDAHLTYEEALAWLRRHSRNQPWRQLTMQVIQAAIEKATKGYNPESDRWVTDFWHSYWKMAMETMPQLELEEPTGKPSGAGFIWYRPSDFPKGVNICHKLDRGYVDLQVQGLGERTGWVGRRLAGVLEPDMRVARANRSAAIRVTVPPLLTGEPFVDQADLVTEGQRAVKRMYNWGMRRMALIVELRDKGRRSK
jgi:hypothetical protein